MPHLKRDIYEGKYFDLYEDKNGKFWIWDKLDETNVAIRAKTELEAYQTGLDMACWSRNERQKMRTTLQGQLNTLEAAFEEVFPRDEED